MKTIVINDVDVHIDGAGEQTIIMLHGWPDTYRMWDAQVSHFKEGFQCVRFTLPGFDIQKKRRGYSMKSLTDFVDEVVNTVSPHNPVILMIHDWGCALGYAYSNSFPAKVSKIIAVDIGDAGSADFMKETTLSAKAMIVAYQTTLASLWKVGGTIGDRLTQQVAKVFKHPFSNEHVYSGMNYFYYMAIFKGFGGLTRLDVNLDKHNLFYAYATKKPFMFHSKAWLSKVNKTPKSKAVAFDSGHWVTVEQADQFNLSVSQWLKQN